MFNLSEKFKILADKYEVIDYRYGLAAYLYDKYKEELLSVYNAIDATTPIAFFGLGYSAIETFKILDSSPKKNIVCLIDSNPYYKEYCHDYDYLNVPIISPDEIKNYNIEIVLVTPHRPRVEMLEYLLSNHPNIKPISIYYNLESRGYEYTNHFCHTSQYDINYYVIFKDILSDLKCEKLKKEKQSSLKLLISFCLMQKDFVNAKIFIDQYISNNYNDSPRYLAFWSELVSLFSDIKMAIKNNNNRNINIFIIDSLTPETAKNISALENWGGGGNQIVFNNAYSVNNYTRGSLYSFISGKYFYDDGAHLLGGEICHAPSAFNELKKYFKINSGAVRLDFINTANNGDHQFAYSDLVSLAYWDYLDRYLDGEYDTIYITHTVYETHAPFFNANLSDKAFLTRTNTRTLLYFHVDEKLHSGKGNLNFSLDDLIEQKMDCEEYFNHQLEFFKEFFINDKDTFIFMGDHGVSMEGYYALHTNDWSRINESTKERFNPFLLIINKSIKSTVFDKMFSYIDLGELIYDLYKGSLDLSRYERSYVFCEHWPRYSPETIDKYYERGCYDIIEGHIIVFSSVDKYVKYVSGREEYYLLSDERKEANLICDNRHIQRIEFFRDLVKDINLNSVYRRPEYALSLKYLPTASD